MRDERGSGSAEIEGAGPPRTEGTEAPGDGDAAYGGDPGHLPADDCNPLPADGFSPSAHEPARPLAPGLYLVSTPIGNLEDLSLRALRVLRSVDRIACEDTRQTAKLLAHFGMTTPLVSYHAHNENARAAELMESLHRGGRIAVVSDAGTPGIADPGATLAEQAIAAGVAVFPIPGANAALSALVASGLPAERFTFHGFLPAREGQRRSTLEALHAELSRSSSLRAPSSGPAAPATHIFYETPHRIVAALADLAAVFGPAQRIVLARELTKLHEEFLRGTVAEVLASLQARPRIRGEMVLLIAGTEAGAGLRADTSGGGPGAAPTAPAVTLASEVAALMQAEGLAAKEALKRVARLRGIGKSEAYREWQRSRPRTR